MENTEKPIAKTSKTLLINEDYKNDLNFQGMIYDKTFKTNRGTQFIIFDNIENATSAYTSLKDNNVNVKYSYYQIFFKLSNIDLTNADYNKLKEDLINNLKGLNENINVLYLKFHNKNGKLIGSGDLTVDLKDDSDAIEKLKDHEFNKGTISFFRYRRKNRNFNNNVQRTTV